MLENQRVLQLTKRPGAEHGSKANSFLEVYHDVYKFRRTLAAGPTETGGYREHDLLQFYAVDGGLRTVAIEDIVIIGDFSARRTRRSRKKK